MLTPEIRQRNLDRLVGTAPAFQAKLLPILEDLGMMVIVGLRTDAQQAADYAQGRTTPGPNAGQPGHPPLGATVTNCNGVTTRSNHQAQADGYGHAADCGFVGDHPYAGDFHAFGLRLEAAGLKWGGRFHAPVDLDHAELP